MSAAPARKVPLGTADVEIERRADGAILLRSPHPLGRLPARSSPSAWCTGRARRRSATFLAQRDAARRLAPPHLRRGPRARARASARRCSTAGCRAERPLAILSDNDIEHALLALACMHVGIAYVPVSSAYSLVSTDHAKLQHVIALLTPGLVFAADGARFAKAIAAAVPAGTEVV